MADSSAIGFFLSMETLQKIIKQWFSMCSEIIGSFFSKQSSYSPYLCKYPGFLFPELLFEQGIVSNRKVQLSASMDTVSV